MTEASRDPAPRTIRRPEVNDIDALLAICAAGFPRSVRWNGSGDFGRTWWEVALASRCAEAWVYEAEGLVLGLTVLITDEAGWAAEKRARCGGPAEYLCAMARNPRLILPEITRRIRLRLAARSERVLDLPDRRNAGPRTWIELTAVSPQARRRGVARILNEWNERRTIELGRKLIERNVEPHNRPMRNLCERRGYVHTRQTRTGCVYSKILES